MPEELSQEKPWRVANPAVTLARTLSNTFAGIAWRSAPAFVGAQLVGAALGAGAVRVLYPRVAAVAGDVVLPHLSGTADLPLELQEERS